MPRSPDRPLQCPTCHWPRAGPQPINHCSLSPTYFTWLSTHPDHNISIQEYSGMQSWKPCKFKANDIHCFSFVHKTSHFITEGTQVVQAWSNFGKSVLMVPDHLLLHCCAPGNVFEEGLLYGLPRNWIPAQEPPGCCISPGLQLFLSLICHAFPSNTCFFPPPSNLMSQLNQIKAYAEYFRLDVWGCLLPTFNTLGCTS